MLEGGAAITLACGRRAPSNGMEDPTLPLWRPAVVHRRTPSAVKRPVYEADDLNLQCGANAAMPPNAVCRVACLAWVGWIGELMHRLPGQGRDDIPLKPSLQKRIRNGLTAVEIT